MDLFPEVFPIILRELVGKTLLNHYMYWNLQQVSSEVRALVNYILPSLRAKRRFTCLVVDYSYGHLMYDMLPNKKRNGLQISENNNVKFISFNLYGVKLFHYMIDERPSRVKGEFEYGKDGRTSKELRSRLNVSRSYDYIDTDEQEMGWIDYVSICHDEYSIVRGVYECDGFALECNIDDGWAKLVEIPKSYGYYLEVNSSKFIAYFWYYESQFYSVYKSKDLETRIINARKLTSKSDTHNALEELANLFGWKYIIEETIFKIEPDE